MRSHITLERWNRRSGLVEVICGPMFSGKTEELIRRLRRAKIARQKVMVFKPTMDNRYDENQVVSHCQQKIPSVAVDNPESMDNFLKNNDLSPSVVGIDEAQFFDERLVDFVEGLAERGIRVLTAGLDQDYLGKPFGPMPGLLAIADLVTKQYAVCVACGAPASKTQRTHRENNPSKQSEKKANERVLVGAFDAYEARCRDCHVKGIDEPSAGPDNKEAKGDEALIF